MKLHEKIAYYRKRAGMSQEALAAQLGVSRQAVSKWETGDSQPELANLLAMARTFGVTTDHLLSDEDVSTAENEACSSERPPSNALRKIAGLGKRYGWLAGVYAALSGVPMLLVGIIMRTAARGVEDIPGVIGNPAANAVQDPVMIISGAVIGIGCCVILGGAILAVYLKNKLK